MSSDGLYVQCHSWAPKKQDRPRTVSRVMCLLMTEDYCHKCPHSRFILHMLQGVGHQEVACPRWDEGHRYKGDMPSRYVSIPRETCLTTRPFEYCPSCPNSTKENAPMCQPGWYEERETRGKNEQSRSASSRGMQQDGAPSDPRQAQQRRTSAESHSPQRTDDRTHTLRGTASPERGGSDSPNPEGARVLDPRGGLGRDQQPAAVLGRKPRKMPFHLPVLRG